MTHITLFLNQVILIGWIFERIEGDRKMGPGLWLANVI
jgi:hypothetical protein